MKPTGRGPWVGRDAGPDRTYGATRAAPYLEFLLRVLPRTARNPSTGSRPESTLFLTTHPGPSAERGPPPPAANVAGGDRLAFAGPSAALPPAIPAANYTRRPTPCARPWTPQRPAAHPTDATRAKARQSLLRGRGGLRIFGRRPKLDQPVPRARAAEIDGPYGGAPVAGRCQQNHRHLSACGAASFRTGVRGGPRLWANRPPKPLRFATRARPRISLSFFGTGGAVRASRPMFSKNPGRLLRVRVVEIAKRESASGQTAAELNLRAHLFAL